MHTVIAIMTSDGLDQITESLKVAALEMLDLKDMGCDNVKAFVITGHRNDCWQAANAIESRAAEGKPIGRKAMREFAQSMGVDIKLHGSRSITALALGDL